MRSLLPIILVWSFLTAHGRALEEGKPVHRKSSVFHRLLHPFARQNTVAAKGTIQTKTLALTMTISPLPLDLSDTRQLHVTLRLTNISKRFIQLEFPTTQRIEILIRDDRNAMVTQWSEDQSFSNGPTFISINPGEYLEYAASISTRDMAPGRAYAVESFFPNFQELKARQQVVPAR